LRKEQGCQNRNDADDNQKFDLRERRGEARNDLPLHCIRIFSSSKLTSFTSNLSRTSLSPKQPFCALQHTFFRRGNRTGLWRFLLELDLSPPTGILE
jgi:hypothetical protein